MAILLTNQATLNYRFGSNHATSVSNITSTVLNGSLSITKRAMENCYEASQIITFIIDIKNNSSSAASNAIIMDDLGTFNADELSVTPLTYVGNAILFVNGISSSGLNTIANNDGVIFEISEIPPKGTAQIIYLAQVNQYACTATGSTITNTATAENGCDCPCEEASSGSCTITACERADLRIVKSVCPNPVTCDERLTYTFNLYNYGNLPANDVIVTDTFVPELKNLQVTVNGDTTTDDCYDYINGTITLPAEDSSFIITVPPCECVRNSTTGVVETNPGTVQIIISGNL